MTWLLALGPLKRFGSWLGSLNLWQLAFLAALLFAGVQTIRVKIEQRHSQKVEQQLAKATDALRKREAESKAQQKQVADKITRYITVEKPVVRTQVERVESAPLPGGCKTPQAVLDADL